MRLKLYAAILHFLLWEILVTQTEFKTNYLLLLLINKNLLLYMLHGFSVTILKCYKDAYQALIQTSVSRFGTLPQFIKYILAKTCFCCKNFLKRFEQVLVNFQCHFSGKRCLFLLILIFKVTSCLCNNSVFSCTAKIWNSLSAECFPLNYDLNDSKSRDRYIR